MVTIMLVKILFLKAFFATCCNRWYSSTMLLSVINASLCKESMLRFSHVGQRLIATYAWPAENILLSSVRVTFARVRPCVLWTVNANEFCRGNCVRDAFCPAA